MSDDKFVTPVPLPTDRQREILTIIVEECAEVIQRCSKALRFGLDEVQPGQQADNATRIGLEVGDLLAMLDMAVAEGILHPAAFEVGKKRKVRKLATFMQTAPSSMPDHRPWCYATIPAACLWPACANGHPCAKPGPPCP